MNTTLRSKIDSSVWRLIDNSFRGSVSLSVENSVGHSVWHSVWDSVYDSVYDPVWNINHSIINPLQETLNEYHFKK